MMSGFSGWATVPAAPNLSMSVGVIQTSNVVTGSIEVNVAAFTTGSLTGGSVVFGGTNGLSSQDNANFFWDDTTKRLGVGDNTPTASFVVGSGDLFQVFGATGNVTTQGDITLATGGGAITATGGALTLTSGAASNINLLADGAGSIGNIQIGAGGVFVIAHRTDGKRCAGNFAFADNRFRQLVGNVNKLRDPHFFFSADN